MREVLPVPCVSKEKDLSIFKNFVVRPVGSGRDLHLTHFLGAKVEMIILLAKPTQFRNEEIAAFFVEPTESGRASGAQQRR